MSFPRAAILGLAAAAGLAASLPARAVERPPQYVVMAFDNCSELERWRDLIDFARDLNRDGDRLRFTFFVSGANVIVDDARDAYQAPRARRGTSRINFGGPPEQVRQRIALINEARRDGHEIASHAVGHFDGAHWSAAEWTQEFKFHADLIDRVAAFNKLPDEATFTFSSKDIVGFRAPFLARGPGLYAALAANGFRYDTSADSDPAAWPDRIDGVWRFNLARIPVAGSRRTILSMDYNFFMMQSRARDEARRTEAFREQMLASYLAYFRASYAGNRAPVHIGHHFVAYQGGAYLAALKQFARAVCGLPEVRCVSYVALADFMDSASPATLDAYRKGDFPRATAPDIAVASAPAKASAKTP